MLHFGTKVRFFLEVEIEGDMLICNKHIPVWAGLSVGMIHLGCVGKKTINVYSVTK